MRLAALLILLAGSVLAAEKTVEVRRSVGTVRVLREFDGTGKLVKERTVKEHKYTALVDGAEVELPATANSRAALTVALRARFGNSHTYTMTDKTKGDK
jgi:hypothetical protein